MNPVSVDQLNQFVNNNIDAFHQDRARLLSELPLRRLLRSKNPYLFKAKNVHTASALVEDILNAFLSSSEEKLFGDFLERLAIYVSSVTCGGHKSGATGLDLEFSNDGVYYIVSIKSGTSWGNSTQQKKQEMDFQEIVGKMKQANPKANIQPVLGICYGKTRTSFLRGYMKVVGQSFWYLISGDTNLYTGIIEPLGYRAKEHNDAFLQEKGRITNVFTQQFLQDFCDNGVINWERLVRFNSGNMSEAPAPEEESLPLTLDEE